MNTVRAKFKVMSHTRSIWYPYKEVVQIKLNPVTSGSEENKRFYEATPDGSIELSTVNENVGNILALGKEVYVDFTPAED